METLHTGYLGAGSHAVQWQVRERPAGVYYYRVEVEGAAVNGKLLVLR